jgi:hypothetical protein
VIKHRCQPLAADITISRPVKRVADGHVIGRDGFCHGRCRTTDMKEPSRYFLPRTDFRKGAVLSRVEIDLKCLLVCGGTFAHNASRIQSQVLKYNVLIFFGL